MLGTARRLRCLKVDVDRVLRALTVATVVVLERWLNLGVVCNDLLCRRSVCNFGTHIDVCVVFGDAMGSDCFCPRKALAKKEFGHREDWRVRHSGSWRSSWPFCTVW